MSTRNPSILNIAGRNANDIYQVLVPANLLGFCKYDFTRFMEDCNQLCRECMKTGEFPVDQAHSLRNSISNCHRYYENNMRSVFEKIVTDCCIEYICRQGEMGTATLWNSLINCKTPFQRAIFQRLSEYRNHYAVNEWVNLLKMQEYAQRKLDYVFGCRLRSIDEAKGRLNFFDLMFSVAANEQGYSLDTIGAVRVYKPGRLTNAPFVYGGAAKEIVRNLFKEVHFAENLPYVSREEGVMSDWEAMDAFGAIKGYIPGYSDNVVNTIIKSMVKLPDMIYEPTSFKAMIDLEIDALLNCGAYLQRCRRCNEFYVRDELYTSDYCDTVHRDGSTCREIMEQPKFDPPTPEQLEELKTKSDSLYMTISERVGKDIAARDFNEWLGYFNVIKNKVINGDARPDDFDDFMNYTNEYTFPVRPQIEEKPAETVAEKEEEKEEEQQPEEPVETTPDGKHIIKPYQFVKIDRKELEKSGMLSPSDKSEEEPVTAKKEPTAVLPPPPPVAKIIRGTAAANYNELPVRPISNGSNNNENFMPIKKDVFLGEDFSLSSAASTPINADENRKPETQGRGQDITPKTESNKSVSAPKPPENKGNHFLPDLEHFIDLAEDDEDRYQEQRKETKDKAPKLKLPEFKLLDDSIRSDIDKNKGTENNIGDNKSQPANVISDNDDDEPIDLNEILLENKTETKRTETKSAYNRYKASNAYGTNHASGAGNTGRNTAAEQKRNPENSSESRYKEETRLNDMRKKSEEKPLEMNRAAKVVSAYKTVTNMPAEEEEQKREKTAEDNKVAEDFAKLLGNIERNDGFEDEDLPLDADGVPLSHKTKHVMDAIMKNTAVSPSLVYGRRQAAEKNVVLDDTFGSKKDNK